MSVQWVAIWKSLLESGHGLSCKWLHPLALWYPGIKGVFAAPTASMVGAFLCSGLLSESSPGHSGQGLSLKLSSPWHHPLKMKLHSHLLTWPVLHLRLDRGSGQEARMGDALC